MPRWARGYHKLFPTMAVKAMRKLDLAEFDIIIASTYLHGHQITKSRPDQTLIAYCHTPPRYYWSHYKEYRKNPGYGKLNPIVRALMPIMIPHQRKLDLQAAKKVDLYIANSTETAKRIKQYYGRKSIVVHPGVATTRFAPTRKRGDYYVTMGRQLPYKRYDLAVKACTTLGLKLKVFGNGPMHQQLVKMAGPTVEFYTDRFGDASDAELEKALNNAKGFIYAAEEDFGIVTVEALAAGAPVIAYGKAGTLDIVDSDEVGTLFRRQTVEDTIGAIKRAEGMQFFPSKLQRTAKRFDRTLFITKMRKIVSDVSSK
jgi:glycosyltransferase involved in cell wall biosynthesis